ncbi:MAG: M23 family metallopeptidase [Pseudomonadota bacterium]|nr:M23 family metallopeptidase [Pseudomonadota bacterium]
MNFKKIIVIILYVIMTFIVSNCARNISFPKVEEGIFTGKGGKHYNSRKIKIITGDTLKSISRKYSVSIRELIKRNNLKTPYILKPGKTLIIPMAIKYKIRKGDSLYKIAECSNISIEDIRQRNKYIQERKLKIGNIIKMPYFAEINKCKAVANFKKQKNKKYIKSKKIFRWPVDGKVIATFGIKTSGRRNDGINIKAPYGSPVRASKDGKVIYRGNELPAWGNLILVKHKDGWTTAYAHLDKFFVKLGSELKTGEILGSVGKTGNVFDYQLHFQVRKKSKPLDPIKYLYK